MIEIGSKLTSQQPEVAGGSGFAGSVTQLAVGTLGAALGQAAQELINFILLWF